MNYLLKLFRNHFSVWQLALKAYHKNNTSTTTTNNNDDDDDDDGDDDNDNNKLWPFKIYNLIPL